MSNKKESMLFANENQQRPATRRQFTVFVPEMEKVDPISQTIPDQGLSISQMLQRVRMGLPINSGGSTPIWNGTKLLPDWKTLDLIDRAAIVKAATDHSEKLKKRKADLEAKKAKADAEAKEKFEKEQAEQRQREIAAYVQSQTQKGA